MELALEEHGRVEVVTLTVVEIAGDDDKGSLFLYGKPNKSLKSPAGRSSEPLDGSSFIAGQAHHRAVQVDVCTVHELHDHPLGQTSNELARHVAADVGTFALDIRH
jgi:hypothetical protein